ncbi:hypothetical protein HN51_048340 [Arachis hypogaea]|uniref:Uncharacterized protein n=1 Tax=Arachis hypogaea TaxID=3818 RepID=A0A445AKT2_ARAHY|nr:nodulation-signaling pathway 2 protein-like [Arachis ipaensis]XP_025636316.1 nodulation-signaling pathway 2 protein-like [Arachis hypogaea]QHO24853.1 Nodulation-signaling pathway 2 protein [Arachis hypogaea]RYR27008.1 hypothetical protein Ahy_B02g061331 [Arachis hypogaea]
MMHSHHVPKSLWSFLEENSSTLEFHQFVENYGFMVDNSHMGNSGFNFTNNNPLFNIPHNNTITSSNVSSIPYSNDDTLYHNPVEEEDSLQTLMDYFSMELDNSNPNTNGKNQSYQEESGEGSFYPSSQNMMISSSEEGQNGNWSPTTSLNSDLSSSTHQFQQLFLPQLGMEIDKRVVLPHMVEAIGEALGKGHKSQVEEILRSMRNKASPIDEPFEFYLSQGGGGDYLKQEAIKHFEDLFRALYQGTPHGKVANFVANSSILEAIPHDCDVIHIFDFDLVNGIQWPSMIEAIAPLNKTLKLTSIKSVEEGYECNFPQWNFEEVKRSLYEHARSCGFLKLKVEEKGIEEVVMEIKKVNKRGGKKEFFAFNCMVGLPHMGREKSRKRVMEFLNLIHFCGNKRAILTFGDGGAYDKWGKNGFDFKSFYDANLVHYKALLESIESHFPTSSEARAAIECLFLAPNVSSLSWLQQWEEISEGFNFHAGFGLDGCGFSKSNLMEIGELMEGCDDSYGAKIGGQNGNELVLLWKGIQLLRVSTWRN